MMIGICWVCGLVFMWWYILMLLILGSIQFSMIRFGCFLVISNMVLLLFLVSIIEKFLVLRLYFSILCCVFLFLIISMQGCVCVMVQFLFLFSVVWVIVLFLGWDLLGNWLVVRQIICLVILVVWLLMCLMFLVMKCRCIQVVMLCGFFIIWVRNLWNSVLYIWLIFRLWLCMLVVSVGLCWIQVFSVFFIMFLMVVVMWCSVMFELLMVGICISIWLCLVMFLV